MAEPIGEEETKAAEPSKDVDAKMFWKFAVKAAYLKSCMLASVMEFAKPKRLMNEFAEPVLVQLLKKFIPEIFKAEESRDDGIPSSLTEKVLPDHYHSFEYRTVFAKLRRLGYFVVDAERQYRQLLHDELRYYGLYDFAKFEESNPVVTTVPDAEESKKDGAATSDAKIEVAKDEVKDTAKTLAELKKAAADAEKIAAQEIVAKFGVEYAQIQLSKVGDFVKAGKSLQDFDA